MKLLIEANDVDEVLKQKLITVEDPNSKLPVLREMIEIMKANSGIGLTANQVGLLDRMFIFTLNNGKIEFVINPKVIKLGNKKISAPEGCLSYPGKEVAVSRPKEIMVKYHNGYKNVMKKLSGWEARVFLHEFDHCNGECILGK